MDIVFAVLWFLFFCVGVPAIIIIENGVVIILFWQWFIAPMIANPAGAGLAHGVGLALLVMYLYLVLPPKELDIAGSNDSTWLATINLRDRPLTVWSVASWNSIWALGVLGLGWLIHWLVM